ncbi:KAP family P-loop NTPase fold protein [Clavibacter michiganensis]|uniref:KAP family P-loop NTPase fold protein n=1 Tax=Clavibacter michiganensis TaxID=28447 RepID=UPI003EB7D366
MSLEGFDDAAWADESGLGSDIPGRLPFANAVASQIDRCYPGHPSTVFGLVGSWGSGKTRLLRDIAGRLTHWKVVHFSPWSAADSAAVTKEFIAALSSAFPRKSPIYKRLGSYARYGTPLLQRVPVFGGVLTKVVDSIWLKNDQKHSWHADYSDIAARTEAQGTRVLVIIDDVDRLQSDELYALLRVVRLLGRFRNVHYLMSYDEDTLRQTLGESENVTSSFLEKIVQYPYEVPPIAVVERRRWSQAMCDEFGSYIPDSATGFAEMQNLLVQLLAEALETPRAAGRLNAQLRTTRQLAADAELFAYDFIALSFIRLSHHALWDNIRRNHAMYKNWGDKSTPEAVQARYEHMSKIVSGPRLAPLEALVGFLFDSAHEPIGAVMNRRMRDERYFERYFHVNIADDDVSEDRISNALQFLLTGESTRPSVLYLKDSVLGEDQNRALLSLAYARQSSMPDQVTSLERLRYVAYLHTIIEHRESRNVNVWASVDQWLAGEIHRALRTQDIEMRTIISTVGYESVVASAYWARRNTTEGKESASLLYTGVCLAWLE